MAIHFTDHGDGHPFLVLHGGGGPFTVAGFADHLAATRPARTIVPTMPGFDGTERPESCRAVDDVAALYLDLLDDLDLHDVTLVGSSAGGWVAAVMAVLRGTTDDRISSVVLVNAVGIAVPGHPITDVSGLRIDQLADLSYFEPDRFPIDPTTLPPARREAMAANAAVFADYAGDPYMHDQRCPGTSRPSPSPRSCCGARPTASSTSATAAPTPRPFPVPSSVPWPAPVTCPTSSSPTSSATGSGTSRVSCGARRPGRWPAARAARPGAAAPGPTGSPPAR